MKNTLKMKLIKLTMFIAFCLPLILQAQPIDPPPEPAPFDGGASILIASGVAYGAKKYRDRKSKKSVETEKSESQ